MIQNGFWSHDYATGVEALTKSLSVSVAENKQFLAMVQERARIEHGTAANLAQLSQEPVMHAVPIQTGTFISKSSSLQSALGVFTTETINQAVMHTRVASDLDSKVRAPLQKWCNMYARRIDACSAKLNSLVAGYTKLFQAVNKQRAIYYENCQKFEDSTSGGSPSDPIIKTIRMIREKLNTSGSPEPDKQVPGRVKEFTIAGLQYSRRELAELLRMILADITLTEYKVPLLGSYENVSTGSALAAASRKHLKNDSFAYAEKFGQSLVDLGFLKPVGQISNRYQSLHTSYYQWQELAFELVDESSDESDADSSLDSYVDQGSDSNPTGVAETNQSPTRTPQGSLWGSSAGSLHTSGDSIITATDPSEEQYLQAVLELDKYRCDMELEMMELYQFLDRLERDREEAIKRGMKDFIQATFRLEEQQQMQVRLKAAQSQVDPVRDLTELIARNKTGPFVPTVTVFRGYFNGNVIQTFGVDLAQSKFFVDIVLDWLRDLPAEESSDVSLWTNVEPISEVYKLRSQINTGKPFSPDSIFRFFPLSVVISTFRQYLLELPESLVPFIVYERFKQLYSESEVSPNGIAVVLVQIPQINRIVLHMLMEYLSSHIAESEYPKLADSLALPLARPRAPSAITMGDQHPKLLICDLLKHGSEIFGEVDRKHDELKAAKVDQRSRVTRSFVPESPTPSAPSGSRVVSNSGMRPLSLSLHPAKTSNVTSPSPARLDVSKGPNESPSPRNTPAPRGLGFNPILPISVQPRTPLSTSPPSFTSPAPSASPISPSPHDRSSSASSNGELRPPKVRGSHYNTKNNDNE